MQRNYQGNWGTNGNRSGDLASPRSYSIVRPDGTVISWRVPSSSYKSR